jgi:hypothetical protein
VNFRPRLRLVFRGAPGDRTVSPDRLISVADLERVLPYARHPLGLPEPLLRELLLALGQASLVVR